MEPSERSGKVLCSEVPRTVGRFRLLKSIEKVKPTVPALLNLKLLKERVGEGGSGMREKLAKKRDQNNLC